MTLRAGTTISLIGFDSAWTDSPKAPGAISVIRIDRDGRRTFVPPTLVSFDQALAVIETEASFSALRIVALDQPTIVPNLTSLRLVDRVAASLISWLGGGVQPANRSKIGMFDDATDVVITTLPRSKQGETALVVDDEPSVRMLVTDVLEDLGYTAIGAEDSAAGLQALQSDVRIDLLVTDVGLPGVMNGGADGRCCARVQTGPQGFVNHRLRGERGASAMTHSKVARQAEAFVALSGC